MRLQVCILILFISFLTHSSNVSAQVCTVTTHVGAEGGLGQGATTTLNFPSGLVVDSKENLYISDQANNIIRKITPSGDVSILAGSFTFGKSNGTGSEASFDLPDGLAVDTDDNIYVADAFNNLIRKISPSGEVTTVAGTGEKGSVNGPATASSFNFPTGIAVDKDGNIYVSDSNNNLIRKISKNGMVSTIAGSGQRGYTDGNGTVASFDEPIDIAIDKDGFLYVADRKNHLIRQISPTYEVTTLAGSRGVAGSTNGKSESALFNFPFGIATDRDNNVYIADHFNNQIRKISSDNIVSTVAGSGSQGITNGNTARASFFSPSDVTVGNNGDIYIADFNNHLIRRIICADISNNTGAVCIKIETSAFLEGPYDLETSRMSTRLNNLGYLPGQEPTTFFGTKTTNGQPYYNTPWFYNGTEGVSTDYATSVTDWVLVSLRAEKDDISTVCSAAGLLHDDGIVEFPNGFGCCNIDISQEYYIVIEHRNHLLTMSNRKVSIIEGTIAYDFRIQNSFVEITGSGQKLLENGTYGLYAGNTNQEINSTEDVDLNIMDLEKWWREIGLNSSYLDSDLNLDGDVNVRDKTLFLKNFGIFSNVIRN